MKINNKKLSNMYNGSAVNLSKDVLPTSHYLIAYEDFNAYAENEVIDNSNTKNGGSGWENTWQEMNGTDWVVVTSTATTGLGSDGSGKGATTNNTSNNISTMRKKLSNEVNSGKVYFCIDFDLESSAITSGGTPRVVFEPSTSPDDYVFSLNFISTGIEILDRTSGTPISKGQANNDYGGSFSAGNWFYIMEIDYDVNTTKVWEKPDLTQSNWFTNLGTPTLSVADMALSFQNISFPMRDTNKINQILIFREVTLEIDNSTFPGSKINIPANSYVALTEDIIIDNVNEYLDLLGDNITIDGKGYTITVTAADYLGFIKNGGLGLNNNAPCANCTIKNINVAASGSGSLKFLQWNNGSGWIGQKGFGRGINGGDILFENCSSTGDMSYATGGISGSDTGQLMDNSTITFNNCYSTGAIEMHAGGICGMRTGTAMVNNSKIIINNCYSIGDIGSGAGGICGNSTGYFSEITLGGTRFYMNDSSITINNCYSTGTIGANAGGISGKGTGYFMKENSSITINNCYSTGTIGGHAGGISGKSTGYYMVDSTITVNNCYSTGTTIGVNAGGISGTITGKAMSNSTIEFNNCYSKGAIDDYGGGISGLNTGEAMINNSTITANNCYTIGSIGTDAGGIYGYNPHTNATHSKCIYFNDKSDDITVPVAQIADTWEDTNAVRTIGTTTTNNDVTDIWHNPDASSSWTHRTSGQTSIIAGCTDVDALNYDSNANTDDGNCIDKIFGCTDVNAFNYNSNANIDDGNCIDEFHVVEKEYGDVTIIPYFRLGLGLYEKVAFINNVNAYKNQNNFYIFFSSIGSDGWQWNQHTGSGEFTYNNWAGDGPTITTAPTAFDFINSDHSRTIKFKAVLEIVYGCIDVNAFNYDTSANTDDGNCEYREPEPELIKCNDPDACNYNKLGECKYFDCAGACAGLAEIDENGDCIREVIM